MLLFSIDPECGFASALADALDESLSPHEDRSFEDGEHKLRPLVDPRGPRGRGTARALATD